LQILSNAAKPVVGILGTINRLFLRLFGIRDDRVQAISEEEIRLLVTESHEQGVIDADERKMMNRVLSLGDRTTDSVMTPRNRIVWLDREAAYEENLQIMRERPYSRYPVLRDGSDNDIAGILETKMLPSSTESAGTERLFSTLREPLYVAESTNIVRLLEIFREEHQSVAIVVDEYGDVAGLVTINDILGAIVGRIEDVTESESQPHVVQRQDGSYLLDGKLGIEEFKELLRTSSLPQEDDHDFVTAAGFLIANLGRIPHVGELFSWGRWQLEVVDLDGPRVDKLLLTHKAPPEDEAA
jgi:putative hemolysin